MNEQPARRPAPQARVISDVEQQVTKWAPKQIPPKNPLVPLSLRIPTGMRKQLKMAATTQERTIQDIVQEALSEWLERHAT